MKGLKEFFCKIVAAVICFGMKVFSGNIFVNILREKNGSFYTEMERNRTYGKNKGQADSRCVETAGSVAGNMPYIRNSIYKNRHHLFFRKIFYWLRGPGDRLQNSRAFSINKELGWKKKVLFHLVPE